jgi:hypothetical protein
MDIQKCTQGAKRLKGFMTIEISTHKPMELSSMSAIETAVIDKIKTRAEFGLQKYGTTLERTDLSTLDWLIHAQEEAMDLANYLEVLIQREQAKIV